MCGGQPAHSATLGMMTAANGGKGRFGLLFLILALVPAAGQYALSVHSNLVTVPVTVTDRTGKPITGLGREQFAVLDDSEPREILAFSRQEGAVSMGIVVDLSGSMQSKLRHATSAVRAITDIAGPGDEAFLMTFGDRPEMRLAATPAVDSLATHLLTARPGGYTALIDAVYQGIHEMRATSNRRKALVVISDGGDNHSRYRESELRQRAIESDVQIYAISIVESNRSDEEKHGAFLLQELSELTGGVHFTVRSRTQLPEVAAKLARAMKELYVIGFKPPAGTPGKWRKVRVQVNTPAAKSLRVASRTGYYTPE